MELLLIIGLCLLIVLNILLISVLVLAFQFIKNLKILLTELHSEADKVKVDIAGLRSRLNNKTPLFAMGLSLFAKRQTVKKILNTFLK